MQVNLGNKKILITREERQAAIFAELIKECQGVPVKVPLLKIKPSNRTNLHQINFHNVAWIFFTSSNGVECFFELLEQAGYLSQVSHCRFAAVGTKTAEALMKKHKTIDFIPTKFNADTMAEEFSRKYPKSGKILLVRGNLSRDVLPREFSKKGYDVEKVEVYTTTRITNLSADTKASIKLVDFITFTSPSTVEAFIQATNKNKSFLEIPTVCIGTTTAARAKSTGFKTTIIPDVYTIESMLEALHKYLMNREER